MAYGASNLAHLSFHDCHGSAGDSLCSAFIALKPPALYSLRDAASAEATLSVALAPKSPSTGQAAVVAHRSRSRSVKKQLPSGDMKKIIWLELMLIGASILIFRSVWTLLDLIPWAKSRTGLGVLLGVGLVVTVAALKSIEAITGKKGEQTEDE